MLLERMHKLTNPHKVFVGKIASLSFLHFLRRVLKWQMGPNSFTKYARENVMLEAGGLTSRLQPSPGSEQTEERTLIDCFFAAVSSENFWCGRTCINMTADERDSRSLHS